MPIKGFGSVTSFSPIEEFISATITGEVDVIELAPGTANTAVTVVCYYNPRYTCNISGLSSASSAPSTFNFLSTDFKVTACNFSETAGDVKKVTISGVYYP